MNLTKEQIDTIYKVTNLLDCGVSLNAGVDSKLNWLAFPKENFAIRIYLALTGYWKSEFVVITGVKSIKTDHFPTFEDLKPILKLIPVIE